VTVVGWALRFYLALCWLGMAVVVAVGALVCWPFLRSAPRRRVAPVWPEKVGASWTEDVRPERTRAEDHAPWPGFVRPPEGLAAQFPKLSTRQLVSVARARRRQEHPA
jgi:hypothetical protein